MSGKFSHLKHDSDWYIKGNAHKNSIIYTNMCEVKIFGGKMNKEYANTIAQNLYSQFDAEGNKYMFFILLYTG